MGMIRDDSVMHRIRGGARVFSVTVTWALENGIVTADSMESRGYGIGRRSSFAIFRFRKKDIVALILIAVLFSVTLYGMISGAVTTVYYPAVQMPSASPFSVTAYVAYAVLVFLPTAQETGERIQWKYLQSKI